MYKLWILIYFVMFLYTYQGFFSENSKTDDKDINKSKNIGL